VPAVAVIPVVRGFFIMIGCKKSVDFKQWYEGKE